LFNSDKSTCNHEILKQKWSVYKILEKKCKRMYLHKQGNRMALLKRDNPKQFFATFRKRKKVSVDIPIDVFQNHFKSMDSSNTQGNDNTVDFNEGVVYVELDKEITITEIENAIKSLKRDTSHGDDYIINGYLIECKDFLMPILHNMFNCILITGYFPISWSSAVIVPIFKKGDTNDTNNYRGISLVSNLGKLFTYVINQRLLTWSADNDIITDAQFGFQTDLSTADANFALHSIISKTLLSKQRLYCAFIDFKKYFDLIDRCKLWYKLSKLGMKGKILNIIHSIYLNVRSCVTVNGFQSEYFTNKVALMQGEVLSPILFSMYVNDFEINFINAGCIPYECKNLNLY